MKFTQKLDLKAIDTGKMDTIKTGLLILNQLKAEDKNIPKPLMLEALSK